MLSFVPLLLLCRCFHGLLSMPLLFQSQRLVLQEAEGTRLASNVDSVAPGRRSSALASAQRPVALFSWHRKPQRPPHCPVPDAGVVTERLRRGKAAAAPTIDLSWDQLHTEQMRSRTLWQVFNVQRKGSGRRIGTMQAAGGCRTHLVE